MNDQQEWVAFLRRNRARMPALLTFSLGLGLAVLVAKLYKYATYVGLVLPLWYGEYGEGIVWQQALLIPGNRMYGDINTYPYIVFHYPPFYHLVVKAISSLGLDMLLVGRAVSVAATIAIAALVTALTYRMGNRVAPRSTRFAIAAIAGLTVLVHNPVEYWSTMMRVDMLGIALAFGGVFLVVLSRRRASLIYAAMICFVLAVYSKQTLIAAPLATLSVLLCTDPRLACKGIAFGAVLGLGLLGCLEWWTDGRFLEHIIIYNLNPTDVARGLTLLSEQSRELIFLLLALFALVAGWIGISIESRGGGWRAISMRLSSDDSTFVFAATSLYFVLSLAMLPMIFKEGAAQNYFVEAMSVSSLLVGWLLNASVEWATVSPSRGRTWAGLAPHVVIGSIVVQALLVSPPPTRTLTSQATASGMTKLLEMVRNAQKPVLSDDMITLLRAGKEVPLEPAIFSSLARAGIWSEQPLIRLITSRGFAFIVTENGGRPGHSLYFTRYTEPVRQAIETAYPNTTLINRAYTVHLP